jgi:hypothetical protein
LIGQVHAGFDPFGREAQRVRRRFVGAVDAEWSRAGAGRVERQRNQIAGVEMFPLGQLAGDQDARRRIGRRRRHHRNRERHESGRRERGRADAVQTWHRSIIG